MADRQIAGATRAEQQWRDFRHRWEAFLAEPGGILDSAGVLNGFTGMPVYDYDSAWRVPARFTPYDGPHRTRDQFPPGTLLGHAHFQLSGANATWEVNAGRAGELHIAFRDGASFTTERIGTRVVVVEIPHHETSQPFNFTLDFNYSVNNPSSLTPFAGCPLPARSNWTTAAIEAGEKRPQWVR